MMATEKRGQLSFFIMFGLVILVCVMLVMALSKGTVQDPRKTDASAVDAFVQSCVDMAAAEAVRIVSLQGGYYQVPAPSRSFKDYKVPLYWQKDHSVMPDEATLKRSLALAMETELDTCMQGITSFEELGFSISMMPKTIEVELSPEMVQFLVRYPMSVTREGATTHLESFRSDERTQLYTSYLLAQDIMSEQENDLDSLPLGYITDVCSEAAGNYTFDTLNLYGDDVLVMLFSDRRPQATPFLFANRYTWSAEQEHRIIMDPIPNMTVYAEYPVNFTVTATGENVTFADYTELFDINETTGAIAFTPTAADAGKHAILITATDAYDSEDASLFEISIIRQNNEPVLDALPDSIIRVGETLNLTAHATDPDNDTIHYLRESSLSSLSIDVQSGVMTYTPSADDVGVYTITITAVDPSGTMDQQAFRLEVLGE
jgi:hypothetical protein